MDCIHCKYPDSRVVETRQHDDNTIRRRRECIKCGKRFTTQEHIPDRRPNDDRFPKRDQKSEHYR